MANTTNLNLVKLSGSEKLKNYPTNQAGNMDIIDAAFGAGFGVSNAPNVNASIKNLADGLAIVANGNTHAAITSGQYVYVRNHGSLSEGLYTATANISANGTLSGSNLTADSSGGLNALNSKINIKSMTSTDLNAYTGTTDYVEYYKSNDITQFTNKPSNLINAAPFVLEIIKFQYYTKQILHVFNASLTEHITYIRQQTYSGGAITWGNWNSYALNSKIDTVLDKVKIVRPVSNKFTLGNGFRGFLFASSAYANAAGLMEVYTNSSGEVTTRIYFGTFAEITFNTSVNGELSYSTSRYVEMRLMKFE